MIKLIMCNTNDIISSNKSVPLCLYKICSMFTDSIMRVTFAFKTHIVRSQHSSVNKTIAGIQCLEKAVNYEHIPLVNYCYALHYSVQFISSSLFK